MRVVTIVIVKIKVLHAQHMRITLNHKSICSLRYVPLKLNIFHPRKLAFMLVVHQWNMSLYHNHKEDFWYNELVKPSTQSPLIGEYRKTVIQKNGQCCKTTREGPATSQLKKFRHQAYGSLLLYIQHLTHYQLTWE